MYTLYIIDRYRRLAGYSPRGRKELDIPERLTLSLSFFHAAAPSISET